MLKDVTFYQYTHDSLERTVCKLLEKVYESKSNAVVLMKDETSVATLDSMIWTYATMSFLPHGSNQLPFDQWSRQPIFLTDTQENPNHAKIIVTTTGETIDAKHGFVRCLDLVDEKSIATAKKRKEKYVSNGCQVTWWQQDIKGSWKKSD